MKDEQTYEAERQEQAENGDARPDTAGRGSERPRTMSMWNRSFMPRRSSTMNESIADRDDDSGDDEDDDESTALRKRRPGQGRSKSTPYAGAPEDLRASTEFNKSIRRSGSFDGFSDHFFSVYSSGITLKRRTIHIYVGLCELKSFLQLNKTGFTKVLKKYDKTLDRELKKKYIETAVAPSYAFQPSTMQHLEENISKLEQTYADIVTQGDVETARKELRLHLREHVVWERNTVWREMIGIERKAQAANLGLKRTLLGHAHDHAQTRLQGDDDKHPDMKQLSTPVGKVKCPPWLLSSTMITLVAIVAVFFILLYIPIMKKVEEQNCLAMLVFVSLLWATEVSFRNSSEIQVLIHPGHSFIRHIAFDTILMRRLESSTVGRPTSPSSGCQCCDEIHLRSYVDASNHAPTRRVHSSCSVVEVRYR